MRHDPTSRIAFATTDVGGGGLAFDADDIVVSDVDLSRNSVVFWFGMNPQKQYKIPA